MSNSTIDTTGMVKVSCKFFIKENEVGRKCTRERGELCCIVETDVNFTHCDSFFYIDWIDYIKHKHLLRTI